MSIKEFKGPYRWLSNFHLTPVEFEGITYPSTEHAYQAAKTNVQEVREMMRDVPTCANVRRAGQLLPIGPEWHTTRKFEVMEEVLRYKFTHHEDLKQKLLATGDEELIEGTTWHDNCWGSCTCTKCGDQGQNHLGRLLMQIREEIRNGT